MMLRSASASAAGSRSESLPPARAIVGRPPPLPPISAAASRITSPAFSPRPSSEASMLIRIWADPFSRSPAITTAGACFCLSRSETASGSPLVTSTTSTVTSPAAVSRVTTNSGPATAAGCCFDSLRARSSSPRSSSASAARPRSSAYASPEETASIRRAPEPTEPSERITNGPTSAVDRTWVPPQSSREKPSTSTTRTISPYFSPKSICAPSFRASSIGVSKIRTGRFRKTCSLTSRSTSSRSSDVSARSWVKSKRSLSGRTAEPACLTCSPSTCRSASWRRWVAVWFAIVGNRTDQGTTARTRSPAAKPLSPPPAKTSTWSSPVRWASSSVAIAPDSSWTSSPASVTWPPPAA